MPVRTLSQLGKLSPLPSRGCTCGAYYERNVHPPAAPRAAVLISVIAISAQQLNLVTDIMAESDPS